MNKRNKRQMSEIIGDEPEVGNAGGVGDFSYQAPMEISGGGRWGKFLVVLIVIVLIVAGGWYALGKYTGLNLPGISKASQSSGDWQAVFLDNGQVYFGKIGKVTKDNLVLNDIYYLQVVSKPLQQTQQETGKTAAVGTDQQNQELTLIKLGNELHGPQDSMTINSQHILLTEQLKNDSRVVQAIDNYLEQSKK